MTAAPARNDDVRGRTTIASRALNRVAAAVSADELGVDAGRVGIDLHDAGGDLAIAVRSPIRVVSLDRVAADPAVVARSGGTLLDRAASAQDAIAARVAHLTGSSVGRVTVRLTGAVVLPEKRVR